MSDRREISKNEFSVPFSCIPFNLSLALLIHQYNPLLDVVTVQVSLLQIFTYHEPSINDRTRHDISKQQVQVIRNLRPGDGEFDRAGREATVQQLYNNRRPDLATNYRAKQNKTLKSTSSGDRWRIEENDDSVDSDDESDDDAPIPKRTSDRRNDFPDQPRQIASAHASTRTTKKIRVTRTTATEAPVP